MSTLMAKTPPTRRPRRRFDDDFKAQAVRLVLDEGKSVGAVARDLDLTETALRVWVKQAQADRSKGRTGLTTAEREELARLRKENRILAEERDILKNVWSAPPLQGLRSSDGEAVCVNVSGLLVEPTAPGLDGMRAHRSS
jgi:transposase